MFIFALFCLLAVGSQAKPVVEPAQHIVIVTPQAQVHLEPALRYVHGLSQLARVSGPHHEETIVYVPAGAAAAVVPNVVNEAVVAGRQIENIPATAQQIQQQAQQGVEIVSGQFGEAAAAAAATGAGFFPGFFPSSNQKQEEQQLKLETPANTQPLPVATEARHFYSLPQVYHTPVVDVVHTPVYSWPISTIRARSIQADEAALPAIELKAEAAAAPEQPLAAAAIPAIAIEPAQPLLKEQKQEQAIEQQP
ncbi:CG13023, partial [Drosophila busckii]